MDKRREAQITPEIEAWRDSGPLKKWLAAPYPLRVQRRAKVMETFGISKTQLHYWVNGVSMPPVQKFVKLCLMIGCRQQVYLDWFYKHPMELKPCEDALPQVSA